MVMPSACAPLPHAPMTKASLTAVQAISSMPFAFSSSALSTKPGRCLAEQVGVKAPGTEKSATLRPLKRSEESRVGKECVVRVDLGGRRIITKKKKKQRQQHSESQETIRQAMQ